METTCLPFLVLEPCLEVIDGIGRLHLKGDRLASEGLNEDCMVFVWVKGGCQPAVTKVVGSWLKSQEECRLLLDVVVGEDVSIIELLSISTGMRQSVSSVRCNQRAYVHLQAACHYKGREFTAVKSGGLSIGSCNERVCPSLNCLLSIQGGMW